MSEVVVSIICDAYNHEHYIAQCLESFVMQKTNFIFEVLVHDDASTDNTANIIRGYKKKYPDIIKPIYQTKNQYSQHTSVWGNFQFPRAQGKYIAICEGDDYWTDPLKLQKQVDALEQNMNIDICFHPARIENSDKKHNKYLGGYSKNQVLFSTKNVIEGGGEFMPTASIMFRSKTIKSFPSFFNTFPVADYFLQCLGSLRGGAIFLPDVMCTYRMLSVGSWSSRQQDIEIKILFIESMKSSLDIFADYLGPDYIESVKTYKAKFLFLESVNLLRSNNKKYINIIENSWESRSNLSLEQYVLFKMRKHTTILNKILLIHQIKTIFTTKIKKSTIKKKK